MRQFAKHGFRAWISGTLPNSFKRPRKPNKKEYPLYLAKFQDIVAKNYVEVSQDIVSFMDFFGVEKLDNIRMVYNGSLCGLNQVVWAPNTFAIIIDQTPFHVIREANHEKSLAQTNSRVSENDCIFQMLSIQNR